MYLSGGKHFTFKCKQRESLPEVKTIDEDICATAPVTKKKSVLFSSSPDEILGLGLQDIQLSDEETLKLDAEELNMQRQPSLQQPLTPSTSDKGEILASEYLSNVGIFSKNVAPRAVMVYFYKYFSKVIVNPSINLQTPPPYREILFKIIILKIL